MAADDEVARTHLLVSHLTREIDRLGEQQERYRHECEEQRRGNETLQHELSRLQHENAGLCHRVAREREIRTAAIIDRARLETEIELDSERMFNGLSSSTRGSSVASSPNLSASLPPPWAMERDGRGGLTPAVLSPRAPSPKLPSQLFATLGSAPSVAPSTPPGAAHVVAALPRETLSPRPPLST